MKRRWLVIESPLFLRRISIWVSFFPVAVSEFTVGLLKLRLDINNTLLQRYFSIPYSNKKVLLPASVREDNVILWDFQQGDHGVVTPFLKRKESSAFGTVSFNRFRPWGRTATSGAGRPAVFSRAVSLPFLKRKESSASHCFRYTAWPAQARPRLLAVIVDCTRSSSHQPAGALPVPGAPAGLSPELSDIYFDGFAPFPRFTFREAIVQRNPPRQAGNALLITSDSAGAPKSFELRFFR